MVDGEYRRQGVGRALMTAAVDIAREQGAHRLYTEVDVDNLGAIFLYVKLGFVESGRVNRGMTPTSPHGDRFTMVYDLL